MEIKIEQDTKGTGKTELHDKHGPHPTNTAALRRLKIIEGQVRGIARMVVEEKYCIDIIRQISASRAALNNVGKLVLKRHLDTCVSDAIRDGEPRGRELVDELMELFAKEDL